MRIGKVSELYHISVDNLYYYINYGLLVPPRPKGQYHFDSQTLRDLELILELKALNFSLQEIHRILSIYRILEPTGTEDITELIRIFTDKRSACLEEAGRLEQVARILDSKILELTSRRISSETARGLPVRMLDLLRCPNCGGAFSISGANMNLQDIYSGAVSCSCGYHITIENGILITPNKNTSLYDKPDLKRELYKDLPPKLISRFQLSYNWMCDKLAENPLKDKVVLESYVNAWFFLHNHLEYLDPSSRYIVVDKYPETLLMYKKLIEQQNTKLDILYIADSSTEFPLKKECIDLNIDFFSINEHNFYHHSFLVDRLLPYMKQDSALLGTYFYFADAPKSHRALMELYPESSPQNFSLNYFKKSLRSTPYRLTDQEDFGTITDTGNNLGFGFHCKGEKLGMMSYWGKRE